MLKRVYLFVVNHIIAIVTLMGVTLVAGVFIDGLMEVMLILTASLLFLTYYGNSKGWWTDI